MKLLLDTCSFLWLSSDPGKLSPAARLALLDPGNLAYLSVVSAWEIAVLVSLGRVVMHQPPDLLIPAQRALHGIEILPLTEAAALHVTNLPKIHRDPFDRMLICQALVEGLTLLTPDPLIQRYPVPTAW